MGGGNYDWDVAIAQRENQEEVFTFEGYGMGEATEQRGAHPDLNPYGKVREVNNETPIVVALDVTRSRGEDTKVVYEKLPMFISQLIMNDYVPGPAISFAAIGDATDGDEAPLQVGQFEADNRLDAVLSKFWIEEGGGGSGQESYELAAYFYQRTNLVQYKKAGKKGYFFFIGDEGFYPQVSSEQVRDIIGDELEEDMPSEEVFRLLQEKFHVFFIYPKKKWEERKKDIDAEIRKRVLQAGGQYDGVDIRASLLWNNRNDLDLHVVTPSGERIYYGNKQSNCGGWLDVDMNVGGETTKPVENIRWKKGTAPKGSYKIIVQNFSFHEKKKVPTEFQVELEINGEFQQFTGTISNRGETGEASNVVVHEFEYTPKKMTAGEKKKTYGNYSDETIKKQWLSVLPPENVLEISDSHAILDVMMGALALVEGTSDLPTILETLEQCGHGNKRQQLVEKALQKLAISSSMEGIAFEPKKQEKPTRKKRTHRISAA